MKHFFLGSFLLLVFAKNKHHQGAPVGTDKPEEVWEGSPAVLFRWMETC
jgi:hypothetical protein